MSDAKTNTMSWFLQGDDGTVYGPVDTATLQAWCLQGRIEPDNALSRDRQNWVEAADVPELAMDWLARLDDGTRCGPFNLQLVPGLIENGIIPPDAILENRHTGERRTASGRAIADDLFPDWAPTQDDPAEPEPVREDARPPTEHRTPVSVMEGERPREPLSSFASRLDEDDRDGAFLAEGWPADEPVHHEEAVPPGDLLAGTPLNGEEDLPLSRRLEPLQRSASEARQQLGETRHSLQTLRTAHTVLQDETQRLKDDLAAALKARQKSEQQLLEQQDRAAAAETEVENLKAQLGQMKDHYDRLQLENQNQFEKIDSLQATQLLNEQRFKRELTALRDRADAKTELLAGTVQLLMRDSDLAGHLKSVPLAVSADGVRAGTCHGRALDDARHDAIHRTGVAGVPAAIRAAVGHRGVWSGVGGRRIVSAADGEQEAAGEQRDEAIGSGGVHHGPKHTSAREKRAATLDAPEQRPAGLPELRRLLPHGARWPDSGARSGPGSLARRGP